MHGTFNGVHLRRITSIEMESAGDSILATFRVLEFPLPHLEAQLRLNSPALMILSDETIEGNRKSARFSSGFPQFFLKFFLVHTEFSLTPPSVFPKMMDFLTQETACAMRVGE